jgi:WD40 repeat protein
MFLKNELVLKKTISEHSKEVWKVISLNNSRWASCSDDHLIIIWSSQEPFSKIQTLTNDSDVVSIIKLKNRDILVASCYNPPAVVFWNLKTYKKEQTVEDVRTGFSTHMIELINQHIAISDNRAPHPIVIIDTFEFKIIKRIYDSNDMNFQSSLIVLNSYLFMYIYSGKILVISTKDYKIIYKNQEIENLHGNGGFITINDGKYLVVGTNKSYGLEILEIDY